MTGLSLLTLNIANPSAGRAARQLAWLAGRPEQIMVLTETKTSQGCRLLADAFQTAGYLVFDSAPPPGEYGVMVISRVQAEPDCLIDQMDYLPARMKSCLLPSPSGHIRLIGAYVPSRDASPEKTARKRRWLDSFCRVLAAAPTPGPKMLLGDLNILEPDHQPAYRTFAPFEYDFYRALSQQHDMADAFRDAHPGLIQHSWVGRTGDGYRYDHAFCATGLRKHIQSCDYDHSPRLNGLSDHSALTVTLDLDAPASLTVADPTTATQEPTLF